MATTTSEHTPPRRRGTFQNRDGSVVGVIYARVPPGLATDVRTYAAEKGRRINEVVADALREYLDRADAAEGPGAR